MTRDEYNKKQAAKHARFKCKLRVIHVSQLKQGDEFFQRGHGNLYRVALLEGNIATIEADGFYADYYHMNIATYGKDYPGSGEDPDVILLYRDEQ